MMKQSTLLVSAALILLAGCKSPVNSELTGTPEKYVPPTKPVHDKVIQNDQPPAPRGKTKYKQSKDLQGQKAVPMDILFVVDTSASMCADQRNISRNMNRFVNAFLQNDKIDFQIGVTTTWDSKTFGTANRRFRNGELRPVPGQGENVRFVTPKTKNLQESLSAVLSVGVEAYTPEKPETSGPETEELFSPILAALSDEMLSGPNQGFRRPEAHLAIVLVTDTEDATPDVMNPGQTMRAAYVAQELKNMIRGETTVTVLAAVARYDQMVQYQSGLAKGTSEKALASLPFAKAFPNGSLSRCDSYSVDPAIVPALKGPVEISKLVTGLKGEAFDLKTGDFGGKMASMGKTLLNKAISFKVALDHAPDVSEKITVMINGTEIRRNDLTGWSYNPESNTIILNEGLDLGDLEKFQVDVEYTIL